MKIIRDAVVRVSGDGWAFKMARLLIDEHGNAAVFTPPGKAPARVFKTDPKQARLLKGTGADAEGRPVSWSQRTSGCGYQLAKCRVSAKQLATRWRQDQPDQQPDRQPDRQQEESA